MKENYWLKTIYIKELIDKYTVCFNGIFSGVTWNKEQDLENDVLNFDIDFFNTYPEYQKYSKYIYLHVKQDMKINDHNGKILYFIKFFNVDKRKDIK